MPIHKVSGGYKWGEHGKTYESREDAVKQAQAAYSHGYKEAPEEHKMKAIKRAAMLANKR